MLQIYNFFHKYGLPAINLQRFSFIFIQCAKLFIFFYIFVLLKTLSLQPQKTRYFSELTKLTLNS